MKKASLILSIVLTLAVFFFSAQSGEASGSMSFSLAETCHSVWLNWFPDSLLTFESLHVILRKGAHVFLFFVLGLSWMLTFRLRQLPFYSVLIIGLVIALIEEGIQWLVPERGPSLVDVFVYNLPGYILGSGLMFLLFRGKYKNIAS